jgi:hypothetical protein
MAGWLRCRRSLSELSVMSHRRASRQALCPIFAYGLNRAASLRRQTSLGGVFNGHRSDVQCLDISSAGQTCPHLFSTNSAGGYSRTPAGSMRATHSRTRMERAHEMSSWQRRGIYYAKNGCTTTSLPGIRWSTLCASSGTKMAGLRTAEPRWNTCVSSGTLRRCVRSYWSHSSSSAKPTAVSKSPTSVAILHLRLRHLRRPSSPPRQHDLLELTCRLPS